MVKSIILVVAILVLTDCSERQNQNFNITTNKFEDSLIFSQLYAKYPNFYPYRFNTDSNNYSQYFYNSFHKTKIIQDFRDSINCKIYSGVDGRIGQKYSILIIIYKDKRFTIPIDIEFGEGIEMLNESFTNFYKSISGNKNYTKKELTAKFIDKIMREYLELIRIENPIMAIVKNKPRKKVNSEFDKIDRLKEKQSKEYLNYFKPKVDSLYTFSLNNSLIYKQPKGKYLIYMDSFKQVFIVSISDELIEFRFYNPNNIVHFYI
ncbi:MAG: hypothetical protein KA981_04065 [Bacteroidia bacterium]|nr:hypothetical protein [Bacteroidia bacterium]